MYRILLLVSLLTGASTAPQDGGSITYDQMQPLTTESSSQPNISIRESRIGNVTLTILTGNITNSSQSVISPSETNSSESYQSRIYLTENNAYDSDQSAIRHIRSEQYTTTNYEIRETTTESGTEETNQAEDYESRLKATTPRLMAKFSHLKKTSTFNDSLSPNSVQNTYKRKFRSRCRCERIWNCPKIQITVPRCPDEYFLCCF